MKNMRIAILLGFCLALAAAAAHADTILLKNGNVIEGKVISEDEKQITILIPVAGGTIDDAIKMQFNRDRIREIRKGGGNIFAKTPTNSAVDLTKKAERKQPTEDTIELFEDDDKEKQRKQLFGGGDDDDDAKEDGAKDGKEGEEGEDKDGKKANIKEEKADPALVAKVRDLLKDLESSQENTRNEALDKIVAIGRDATGTLVEALCGNQRYKTLVIDALARIRDKRATSALIDKLYLPAINQMPMRKAAYEALKKITGQSIPYNPLTNPDDRKAEADEWRAWLDKAVEEEDAYKAQF